MSDYVDVSDELQLEESTEVDALLEALSLDMMKDNITSQITGESASVTDFLGIVTDKFYTIINNEEINENDRAEVKHQIVDFCQDLIATVGDTFDLAINLMSDDYETHLELLQTLYNFFVLNRFEHVQDFFINYINMNKMPIIDSIVDEDTGKDITSMSYKKKNIPRENTIILAKVSEIISFIQSSDAVDSMEFLDVIDDGEADVVDMKNYFFDGTIAGGFTQEIIESVIGDNYDNANYARIRNSIRIAFAN